MATSPHAPAHVAPRRKVSGRLGGHTSHQRAPGPPAYLPRGHTKQRAAPAPAYWPETHRAQLDWPAARCERPGAHGAHAAPAADAAPTPMPKRPIEHSSQRGAAGRAWYLPAGHARHSAAVAWPSSTKPGGSARPRSPNLPALQAAAPAHERLPAEGANLPAGHGVQTATAAAAARVLVLWRWPEGGARKWPAGHRGDATATRCRRIQTDISCASPSASQTR